MIEILILTSLLIYSALSGVKDAILFSKSYDKLPYDAHKLFVAERFSVFSVTLLCGMLSSLDSFKIVLCEIGIISVCWGLCFSLVHNSAYYIYRGVIAKQIGVKNPYPKGWASDSTTSTAKFELVFWQRLALFIIGFGGLILYIVFR